MLNKSKNITLICGASLIAITILSYLLIFDNIFAPSIRWISLSFLVLSEIIGTIKALVVKKTIFSIPNIATSFAYVIAVLLTSIIFMSMFPSSIKEYILLNIIILLIFLIMDVLALYFGNHVKAQKNNLSKSQSTLRDCLEKATSLCIEFEDTDYKNDLDEIIELLKYSDNSPSSQDEALIMNKLDELSVLLEDNDAGINKKITETKKAIKLRSAKVANSKRGGY